MEKIGSIIIDICRNHFWGLENYPFKIVSNEEMIEMIVETLGTATHSSFSNNPALQR